MKTWKACDLETCKGKAIVKPGYWIIQILDQISNECLGSNGDPCIFPFNYKEQTFDKCTLFDANANKPWCAVAVNDNGDMTTWKDCIMDSCKGQRNIKNFWDDL